MKLRQVLAAVGLVVIGVGVDVVEPATALGDDDAGGSVLATFEGQTLWLAESWGEARACQSDGLATRCYRTEAEMDIAEDGSAATILATCSTALRLYKLTSFGGTVLALSQRGIGISLSAYGFDNATSSYKIGACSATFFDGGVGSATYPGNTSAGAQATSMLSGWDNRVSTVYIS